MKSIQADNSGLWLMHYVETVNPGLTFLTFQILYLMLDFKCLTNATT